MNKQSRLNTIYNTTLSTLVAGLFLISPPGPAQRALYGAEHAPDFEPTPSLDRLFSPAEAGPATLQPQKPAEIQPTAGNTGEGKSVIAVQNKNDDRPLAGNEDLPEWQHRELLNLLEDGHFDRAAALLKKDPRLAAAYPLLGVQLKPGNGNQQMMPTARELYISALGLLNRDPRQCLVRVRAALEMGDPQLSNHLLYLGGRCALESRRWSEADTYLHTLWKNQPPEKEMLLDDAAYYLGMYYLGRPNADIDRALDYFRLFKLGKLAGRSDFTTSPLRQQALSFVPAN